MPDSSSYHINIDLLGFGSKVLLKEQAVFIKKHHFNLIMGKSGIGKSTLLHALSHYPDANRSSNVHIEPTATCALLPQQPMHTFPPTVKIRASLYDIAKTHKSELQISELLEKLGLGEHADLLDQYPHQCSGGELQRLALIACYLQEPDIILLDEPTAALDYWNVRELIQNLKQWMNEHPNRAVIVTSHQPEAFLEGTSFIIYEIANNRILLKDERKAGLEINFTLPKIKGSLLYEVKGGKFKYSKNSFECQIGISIYKGNNIGITGPSGCGKSTIAKLISGWLQWDTFDRLNQVTGAKGGIQYIGQDPISLFHPFRKIEDQLRMVWNKWSNVHDQVLSSYLNRFKVDHEILSRTILEVSGGQRQRLQLARTFMSRPDVVIMDENFSALDKELKSDLVSDLLAYQAEEGCAILWISHDLDLLSKVCGQVWVLKEGKLVEKIDVEKIEKSFTSAVTNALFHTYNK